MNEIKQYVSFNPGLIMKTHYLTEQMAYFLGGIYASEEQVISSDDRYKIAPVRYNSQCSNRFRDCSTLRACKEDCHTC